MSDTIYIQEDGKKRKATTDELAQMDKDRAESAEQQRLLEAEQTAKAQAKASAMAKLSALGLNEDEVNAIIGA